MKSLGCSSTWIVPVWAFRRALRPELSLSSYKCSIAWMNGSTCDWEELPSVDLELGEEP
jgi:hypothetical protein